MLLLGVLLAFLALAYSQRAKESTKCEDYGRPEKCRANNCIWSSTKAWNGRQCWDGSSGKRDADDGDDWEPPKDCDLAAGECDRQGSDATYNKRATKKCRDITEKRECRFRKKHPGDCTWKRSENKCVKKN